MGLSVANSPFSVGNPLGLDRLLKAVVFCLITYVDFFVSNIKMGPSDP
jgi:hypothetical protein